MYSKKDNLLMIHIPKTGGTAILESFLYKNGHNKEGSFFSNKSLNVFKSGREKIGKYEWLLAHLTYKQYQKLNIFTKEQLDNMIKFTIVRNPYYRFVSYFYMIKKKSGYDNYTINEHIDNIEKCMITKKLPNKLAKMLVMSKPQYLFLEGCNDITIFKHENYVKVENFLKSYGIEKIKKSNMSAKHLIKQRNSDLIKCKDFVNKYFEKDFKTFGYNML